VVNDSPTEDYSAVESLLETDERASYIANPANQGKNASLNKAFALLAAKEFRGHVIFLDDDDWLDPSCLEQFSAEISRTHAGWLVSNRIDTSGAPFTKNNTGGSLVRYVRDCLLLKRFRGDATHCIRFEEASRCLFSEEVKNGEEWLFFAQVARYFPEFNYLDTPGTISEGYLEDGLTRISLSKKQKLSLFRTLLHELYEKRLLDLETCMYMILRLGKVVLS